MLLQKYLFVPLDIFREIQQNKAIDGRLEAWLTFFSTDDPKRVVELIEAYPEFREMYQEAYEICRNMEAVMGFFSEELRELDRNTVQLMIDEMQEKIERQSAELERRNVELEEKEQKYQEALRRIAELEQR